ncbi:uncharacterized protein LOC26526432 [Drosophila erecta]|uniref:Uncharacterized protein n=1 Tax=Drosophila erecta TaxID=7220 RepID=A0A0Q5UK89_DROER|nr:uncharacterized protein LOC26526432 [Drosophila erecta]KQS44279.1 uncharacterized protein Dere_GG26608 [Drosophila erecta]
MILANKFCFCITLQKGCILIALIGIFLAGMNIDYMLLGLNRTYFRETHHKFPERLLYTFLQMIPDLLTILASCILIFAILSQYCWLFWTTLLVQAFQAVYFVIISIISALIGSNLIINESIWHNLTYWIYVLFWLALTAYFMYIIYSYYRQITARETENIVEGLE